LPEKYREGSASKRQRTAEKDQMLLITDKVIGLRKNTVPLFRFASLEGKTPGNKKIKKDAVNADLREESC